MAKGVPQFYRASFELHGVRAKGNDGNKRVIYEQAMSRDDDQALGYNDGSVVFLNGKNQLQQQQLQSQQHNGDIFVDAFQYEYQRQQQQQQHSSKSNTNGNT